MEKRFTVVLFCIVLLFVSIQSKGQKKDGKLKVETHLLRANKYYNGVWDIEKSVVCKRFGNNAELKTLFNQGLKLQKVSKYMVIGGATLIAVPLALYASGSDDPLWFLAGIGVGSIFISIPIYTSGSNKVHEAFEVYNEQHPLTMNSNKLVDNICLVATSNGIGVRMNF